MDAINLTLPSNIENMQLPDPSLVNYYKLAEHRIFYVDYEIDEAILELQRSIILINMVDRDIKPEDRVPIKIFIDSPGGLLSETMSLATTIIMSTTPVITVNVAEAYSGGALLLLAGHKRYAFPYAKAMLHTGSTSGMAGTYEQSEQAQKNYKKQIEEMGSYILERTGMDEKLYKRNKAKDWYMDVNEQLSTGVVHKIVSSLEEII
ncbi:hypothetical protein DW954_02065 [Clostridium sp. AM45-5]|nr:ATP-dependent Clp protease proteolytic subunit [Clostridium sp. AM45-5]RHS68145.1 hypothetical protein DW954_02065 [Clostridium sp. AM45-5]